MAEPKDAAYRVVRYAAALLPEAYRNLIYSKWKRSLRHGNDYFRLVAPAAYYAAYDWYLGSLMRKPDSAVRLAVIEDDQDVVLGFSVSRARILDYVYVHKDMRNQGIARSLVPPDIDTISHVTKTGLVIWANKAPDWAFNPFA